MFIIAKNSAIFNHANLGASRSPAHVTRECKVSYKDACTSKISSQVNYNLHKDVFFSVDYMRKLLWWVLFLLRLTKRKRVNYFSRLFLSFLASFAFGFSVFLFLSCLRSTHTRSVQVKLPHVETVTIFKVSFIFQFSCFFRHLTSSPFCSGISFNN